MKPSDCVRLALSTLGILMLPCVGIAAQPDSPENFLRHLYAQYAPGKKPVAFVYPDAAPLVDASLLALLRHDQEASKGEVGALDYDPVCQCQDWGALKIVALSVRSAGAGRATASVTFDDGRGRDLRRVTVRFELVRVAGAWKIHDVGSHDAASLQGLLHAAKY